MSRIQLPTPKSTTKKSAAQLVLVARKAEYRMYCQSSPVITWKMASIASRNVSKLTRGGLSSPKSHMQPGELAAVACSAPAGTPHTSSQK